MFQARHYKAIAELLYNTQNTITREQLIERFASFFMEDNARFNYARFVAVASGQDPVRPRVLDAAWKMEE